MSRSASATFRLPVPALLFPVLLLLCIAPLATAGGAWAVLFGVPVITLAWVALTRTKATPTTLTAYGLRKPQRISWTDLAGLEFNGPRWAVAVRLDGGRVRLPMVRPRDLPRLAAVSGGSLRLGPDAAGDEGVQEIDLGVDGEVAEVDGTDLVEDASMERGPGRQEAPGQQVGTAAQTDPSAAEQDTMPADQAPPATPPAGSAPDIPVEERSTVR